MKRILSLLIINLIFCQVSFSKSNSHLLIDNEISQQKENMALVDSAISEAKRKRNTGETQTDIFGGTGGASNLNNISYRNFKGGRYLEVAEEENWSVYSPPNDMESRYQKYLERKKKEQNVLYILIGVVVIGLIIGLIYKREKISEITN